MSVSTRSLEGPHTIRFGPLGFGQAHSAGIPAKLNRDPRKTLERIMAGFNAAMADGHAQTLGDSLSRASKCASRAVHER